MHIHRLEKLWLVFGISMLAVFLTVVGVGAFALGMEPPGGHRHTVDPEKLSTTAPFDKPGLQRLGNGEYEANIIAFAFGYKPDVIEIPLGAKVNFNITSSDVVHGFQVVNTTINMMVVPGEVNHLAYTFTEPGEYLVICNEYCGAAHEVMMMKLIVK
ncbi:cytochrome c oxidase subunit II [Paenibacillus mucilaginosus]|uniref:Cytochrome aa3 subunit 2 n=2 Tax=Paenibacillus mucilaginosus TaxID=61624 RepID=H6NRS2_9BACL|nr:cytochrome c oxidase subunit II [Paenibacillus mucilaginosus]AEI45080.1 subunit II of b(o/a)3-type cytochrome c oxidase [Paenibacillus mucilaginosus KNP414]AFC32808.1 subunit II of b3-type cytochrome c oxidase [Paenibacillus mucilaginosus 3016]MCG7213019.1 cytochrome c oxidase subunit II [Paenibacillus mucilaginosus]WDM26574.1 cytochrome c oxidase subunit II [Paenibacillus mucilaginosus]WFA21270.1 cytochrome C oxidase subunit II [Paenibacillus mucilaginosus]